MKSKKIEGIKTIIWDCDNTIWIHREDEANIIAKHFGIAEVEKLGKQFSEMIKQFNKFFEDKKVVRWKIEKIIEVYMPILEKYEIKPAVFLKEWLRIETSFLNDDALEAIKYLDAKGYENIVLTDWLWDAQIMLLKKYGVLPYIKKIYTCDDMYLKRNPKTKTRIIEEGKEEQYIIVGDSLESDIAFANAAGIRSIWFNPGYKTNDTPNKPTYEISSMLELCKMC